MEQIPLKILASGEVSEAYSFTLLMENGQGFCEIKVADKDGNPLSPRLRIESDGRSVRLFVWDVSAQQTDGNHPPGYSHQRVLVSVGQPDPPGRSDSMVLAHAPTSSP